MPRATAVPRSVKVSMKSSDPLAIIIGGLEWLGQFKPLRTHQVSIHPSYEYPTGSG
jgi:hypothetical protein